MATNKNSEIISIKFKFQNCKSLTSRIGFNSQKCINRTSSCINVKKKEKKQRIMLENIVISMLVTKACIKY